MIRKDEMISHLDNILKYHEYFDYPLIDKDDVKKNIHHIKKMRKHLLANDLNKVFVNEVEDGE
jgi:hypothetical protein